MAQTKRHDQAPKSRTKQTGSGVVGAIPQRSVFDGSVYVAPNPGYRRPTYEASGCVIREHLSGERLA